jgi:hypothetical protein
MGWSALAQDKCQNVVNTVTNPQLWVCGLVAQPQASQELFRFVELVAILDEAVSVVCPGMHKVQRENLSTNFLLISELRVNWMSG